VKTAAHTDNGTHLLSSSEAIWLVAFSRSWEWKTAG